VAAWVPFSSSGALLPPGAKLGARRRALREARRSCDASHVGRRVDAARALLAACGVVPAEVEAIAAGLTAKADCCVPTLGLVSRSSNQGAALC
jgi:hypothetical protein